MACDLFKANYLSKGHIIKISAIKEDIEYTKEYKAEGYNWQKLEQFRRLVKGVNKEL